MKQTMIRLTAVVLAAVMFVTLPAVQGLSHYAVSDLARGIGNGALPETERGTEASGAVSAGISVIVGEETSRRGENTVHFRTSDGGYIAGIYGTAVSYQDGEGSWRAIDNSMAYDAARGVYRNKEY